MIIRIASIVLVSAFFCIPAAAQTEEEAKILSRKAPLFQKIDVDFEGGTIGQFIKAIQEQSNVTPNVIVSAEAAELSLPPISLRSADVGNVLMALEDLYMVDGCRIEVSASSEDVLTISALMQRPRDPNMARAFNVKPLIDQGLNIDDIVTSVNTALSMQSSRASTQLKYHEETNLIIAAGPREEVSTVETIVYTLMESEARPQKKTIDAIKEEILELQRLVRELSNECNRLNKRIEALEAGK
jgi:hypothetical protein